MAATPDEIREKSPAPSLHRATFLTAIQAAVPSVVDQAWNHQPATAVPEPCRPEKVGTSARFPSEGVS